MPATKLRTALRATKLQADEYFTANADLSAASGLFVMASGGYVKLATGASNPTPIGVLVGNAASGGLARVRVFGQVQLNACPGGSAMVFGSFITANASAYGATSGCAIVLGRSLMAASAAANACPSEITAFINCITPGSALGTNGAS